MTWEVAAPQCPLALELVVFVVAEQEAALEVAAVGLSLDMEGPCSRSRTPGLVVTNNCKALLNHRTSAAATIIIHIKTCVWLFYILNVIWKYE